MSGPNLALPIRLERKSRGWSIAAMARKIHDAADDGKDIPDLEAICHNIYRWESGRGGISERYRLLYCRVFGRTEWELFGIEPPGIASENDGSTVPQGTHVSSNSYLTLALPGDTRRIVIEITSVDNEQDAVPQSVRHLTLTPSQQSLPKSYGGRA